MVIEVSKELDVVRIGIDRYSLKTGLKLKTVMDLSIQVIKEPRGFIRIIQCIMAILAFSTTAGFSTECEFSVSCGEGKDDDIPVEYEFGYPFSHTELNVPENCDEKNILHLILPFDFSNAAEFFVATGVMSFLYTILILIVYIFFHQSYGNNPKLPVVDLGISAILSIFWMAGSSAWAQGVADLKYYLHPETVFKFLPICLSEKNSHECDTIEDGSYGVLNGSLILGFANFLLWTSSLWFIYKETVFFSSEVSSEPTQNQSDKGIGKV
ncbi:UNVERIFIED_CONTAM: Synaptophysin [Trichonephila clavipes]|uniref:Synaptophysin n=1 Tax=Trichonephila inaurata madagascariensis TaxID=2747483 RepID=A0A8X6XYU5_9ARAC|nr:synaptophysin [Trichonephila inaurata madagascariensis]